MDSIGGLEASRPPKASSPMPSHPMPSEPCKKVHRTSQLNFCDAIPNPLPPPPHPLPPFPKSSCDNPVVTSNNLHEEDLESNEPIQLKNKFDALLLDD